MAGSALKTPAVMSPTPYTVSRTGPAIAPRPQVRNDSISEAQAEQTGHDEVGTLHPPVFAIGQQADRVSAQVEAVAGQDLDHGGGDEQRAGQDPGEQGAAALDAGGRNRGHGAGRGSENSHGSVPFRSGLCSHLGVDRRLRFSTQEGRRSFPPADVENFTFGTTRAVRGRSAPTGPHFELRSTS